LATSAALVSAATENGDDEKGASMDGALPQQQPSMSTAGDASKSSKVKRRGARAIRRASSLANSGNSESSDCAFLQPVCPSPPERYSDLGGIDRIIQELRELVEYPLQRPELYRHLGIDPPRGVLLRGPPGVGKTHVANAGTWWGLFPVDPHQGACALSA
jgi:ribosome biogenesis ATPase